MKLFKEIIVFVGCFLWFTNCIAQEKINQLDANGKKTGVWRKYYSNNNIRYEGQFKADKEIGVFKFYSMVSSNHPTIIKTFSTTTSTATVQYFTVDGIKESEGVMDGKLRIGKWVYYYPDTQMLMIEEHYSNGVLHGVYTSYFKNGKVSEQLLYNNGKLHGNCKRYADNGNLIEDLNYVNGVLNGPATYYNTSGTITSKGTYENDERIDDWKYFNDKKN